MWNKHCHLRAALANESQQLPPLIMKPSLDPKRNENKLVLETTLPSKNLTTFSMKTKWLTLIRSSMYWNVSFLLVYTNDWRYSGVVSILLVGLIKLLNSIKILKKYITKKYSSKSPELFTWKQLICFFKEKSSLRIRSNAVFGLALIQNVHDIWSSLIWMLISSDWSVNILRLPNGDKIATESLLFVEFQKLKLSVWWNGLLF